MQVAWVAGAETPCCVIHEQPKDTLQQGSAQVPGELTYFPKVSFIAPSTFPGPNPCRGAERTGAQKWENAYLLGC